MLLPTRQFLPAKSLQQATSVGAHQLSQQLGTLSWEHKTSDNVVAHHGQFQETSVGAHELSQQSGTQDILISWEHKKTDHFLLYPS